MDSIMSAQVRSSCRISGSDRPAMSAKSWPLENTGPSPVSTTPAASVAATSCSAPASASMAASDSALRRLALVIVIVVMASVRSMRTS